MGRWFFSIRGPFLGLRYRIWRVYQGLRGIYYRWRWRRSFKRMTKAIAQFGCSAEEAAAALEAFGQACREEAEKNDADAT